MPNTTAKSGAERIAALRERRRRRGIVEVAVFVPENRRKEIQALARQWCEEINKGDSQ